MGIIKSLLNSPRSRKLLKRSTYINTPVPTIDNLGHNILVQVFAVPGGWVVRKTDVTVSPNRRQFLRAGYRDLWFFVATTVATDCVFKSVADAVIAADDYVRACDEERSTLDTLRALGAV